MSRSSNTRSGGVSFCGVLAIVFIVLKLVGVIDWSWIWVLSPVWISLGIYLIFIVIIAIVASVDKNKWGY